MTTQTMPTIRQMLNRATSGHLRALRNIAEGHPVADARSVSELRGWRTILATLGRWGCVANGEITSRGRELLEAAEQRRHPQ